MTISALSALDQKNALTAHVRMMTALGNIEPDEDAAKRITQPRSIAALEGHDLIAQGVDRIALQKLLALGRDT